MSLNEKSIPFITATFRTYEKHNKSYYEMFQCVSVFLFKGSLLYLLSTLLGTPVYLCNYPISQSCGSRTVHEIMHIQLRSFS